MGIKISLSGHMGAGKDTVALELKKLFQEELQKETLIVSFGEALKEESQRVLDNRELSVEEFAKEFGVSLEEATKALEIASRIPLGVTTKDRSKEIRELLQYWGTEVRRKAEPNYWVEKAREKIKRILKESPEAAIVVTDTRFLNELAMVEEEGFVRVLLEVPTKVVKERILERDGTVVPDEALKHKSETEFKKYNKYGIIINNGYIAAAKAAQVILIKGLKLKQRTRGVVQIGKKEE